MKYLLSIYYISRTVLHSRDIRVRKYRLVLMGFTRETEVNQVIQEIYKYKVR